MRLNLPERQACDLREAQEVQGNATISTLVGMILTDAAPKRMSLWSVFVYYEGQRLLSRNAHVGLYRRRTQGSGCRGRLRLAYLTPPTPRRRRLPERAGGPFPAF